MLHIGDNLTTDFCGARAAGMQALFLGMCAGAYVYVIRVCCWLNLSWVCTMFYHTLFADRSDNERIGAYQEWLKAPDYEGKSKEDIKKHTVKSLREVKQLLMDANRM